MKKSPPLWCEDCRFVCFETGLGNPMLTLNDPNGFKTTTNVYSIHLELRMALPCQIGTGKWKYVNPCLDFLGSPDQRTAYVKRQARPRWTYVRRSSVTPDLFMRHMINQCFIFFQGLVQLKKMASTRMGTPKRVFFYIKIYPTWERLGRHRVQDLKFLQRFGTRRFNCISSGPGNTQRNNKHIIITWKRRFDVIITYLLRCVFAGHYFTQAGSSLPVKYTEIAKA